MKSPLFTAFLFFISTQRISWAQTITAEFSVTPSTIEVGTSTVARCTVNGFANENKHMVHFYMSQTFSNDGAIDQILGFWDSTSQPSKFVSGNAPQSIGVIAEAGSNGTYPNYEINLQLVNIAAQGNYWCGLFVWIPTTDGNTTELVNVTSNNIQTSSPANVASLVAPQYNFTINTSFRATCTVSGRSIPLAYTYNVRIYYFAHSRIDTKLIGQFTIEDLLIEFTADDTVSQVSTFAGNVARPYIFEFLVMPHNATAAGTYGCSIETKTAENDPTAREYFSNEVVMRVLEESCPDLPHSSAIERTILSFCMLFGGLLMVIVRL